VGSNFRITFPFTFSGDIGAFGEVSVSVSNPEENLDPKKVAF
jgi:hypothetical protein